jgi:hypothetical protein
MLATVATAQQTAGQIGRAAIEPVITSYVSDGAHDLVGEGGRTGVDLGEPYLDLSRLGYGIAGGSLYFRFELRGQIPSQVETTHIDSIWYQVLLDVDADSSTGYMWSGDLTPDYMLQLDSSSGITDLHFGVRKYSGAGNDWSWALIGSTERSGGDAVLAGGIGQNFFVLSCRYGDISASEGSRIRFFARSGVLYDSIVYNDFVPDKGTVIVTLPPAVTTSSSATSLPPCPPDCPSMVPAVEVAIAIVGAVLLVIAGLASFLRRPMRPSPASQSAASDWRYVEYLAKLEDLKSRGQISEETYLKLRKEYWEKLEQG